MNVPHEVHEARFRAYLGEVGETRSVHIAASGTALAYVTVRVGATIVEHGPLSVGTAAGATDKLQLFTVLPPETMTVSVQVADLAANNAHARVAVRLAR